MDPKLVPVTAEAISSVERVVANSIRDAILNRRLAPGERLGQDRLAAELRVSRQPVREALRSLESEGLVVHTPQRGTVVRSYSADEVRENYVLRELLESQAAEAAARRITDAELAMLEFTNQEMQAAAKADNQGRVVELNTEFHRRIHSAAGMPTLVRLMNLLWMGYPIFTPLLVPGRAMNSVREHQALIDALRARRGRQAALAMRRHVRSAGKEYAIWAQSAQNQPDRTATGS